MPKAKKTPEEFAEIMIQKLFSIVSSGIPKCYDDFNDYLYDFYPEFGWNGVDISIEFKALKSHNKFEEVCNEISKKFDFDFKTDLNLAIKAHKNE